MTKSEFLKSAPAFANAVINQIGGWTEFKRQASDISNYGADCGVGGFSYYNDTVKFAKKNLTTIIEYAESMANDIGEGDAFAMIAGFNCLNDLTPGNVARGIYAPDDDNKTQVLNALAWFALEEAARAYCEY